MLPKKEINLYIGMTDMQRKWYKMLLEKDIDAVNGEFLRTEWPIFGTGCEGKLTV